MKNSKLCDGYYKLRQARQSDMDAEDLVVLYNYDEFIPFKFERWLNFEASPSLGQPAPDFLLVD